MEHTRVDGVHKGRWSLRVKISENELSKSLYFQMGLSGMEWII